MRCGSCRHEWLVTAEWLELFSQALAACPNCGTDCQSENRPNFCVAPDDPMHDDDAVRNAYWYHSSTHDNWPDSNFDPTEGLTEDTKRRMGAATGSGAVQRWAALQKAKALHVGTYEAAIESMFRRMRDQADAHSAFYLYRVKLTPSCVIEPAVHVEPTNWLGDAYLAEVCPPGTTVLRYVNVHEDKSSVSLAIDPKAVRAVQGISIPLAIDTPTPWIVDATQRLVAAASKTSSEPVAVRSRRKPWTASALQAEAIALESEIAQGLPAGLRDRFRIGFAEDAFERAPDAYPINLIGMARLVTNPQATLDALDAQPWRLCHADGAGDELAS